MRQSALTSRPSHRHDRRDHFSPFLRTKTATAQKPDQPIDISLRPLISEGSPSEDLSPTHLSLEEVEEILIKEYGPLIPWVSWKLRSDYGVWDLPHPDSGSKLLMVAPIAEELVHDTIVVLWEKKRETKVELHDKGHVRNWLKKALKIALLKWAQNRARAFERNVYSSEIDEDEYDLSGGSIEAWDAQNNGTLWRTIEEVLEKVFDQPDGDYPSVGKVTTDELKAALKHLPSDMRKLVNHVYGENMSWQEASVALNIERRMLQREVQQCLHTLRPHITGYQPKRRPGSEDTRRKRKSLHCPVCETKVTRKKKSSGAVCSGCGIAIHKDQFAVQYSYRHA